MLLSQRLDPSRYESHNLIKMCKCVNFFLGKRVDELLCMINLSSLFFLDVDYLSLFFFFWHALWACGIPSLGMHLFLSFFDMPFGHVAYLLWVCIFYFIFFIVHILDGHISEKESWYVEFYFVGQMTMFAIFQCRSIACEWMCTWSWSWEYDKSLTRVKEFDKTQSKVKLHMKVWAWKSNFGFGKNFH